MNKLNDNHLNLRQKIHKSKDTVLFSTPSELDEYTWIMKATNIEVLIFDFSITEKTNEIMYFSTGNFENCTTIRELGKLIASKS